MQPKVLRLPQRFAQDLEAGLQIPCFRGGKLFDSLTLAQDDFNSVDANWIREIEYTCGLNCEPKDPHTLASTQDPRPR